LLVKARELPRITVIEFGVAGGNGRMELERVAADAYFSVQR
jgi:hypothetical protein